jgi:hypothetical protein
MISMERIVGTLISGGAVRLYALGLGLYVGLTALDGFNATLATVAAVLDQLP